MKDVSFLHLADVHLDSPLAGLRRVDASMAERLQLASRRSLEIAVDAAIAEQIPLVVIAGDLFDGPVKDSSAGLWVEGQFKRLGKAGINVALIRGNHDALSNACRATQWPENVMEFGHSEAATVQFDQLGIAVHGQSFGAREEATDMAADYPRPLAGYVNIGLLHTSLSGAGAHDTYAPTTLTTLENVGYDYWALGHIHQRSTDSLSTHCYVGFSGNTQGRHIRESGPKGCHHVSIQDGRIANVEFLPTDSVRWEELSIDVTEAEHLRDLEDILRPQAERLIDAADGRPVAVRLRIIGATPLHADLTRYTTFDGISQNATQWLTDIGDFWLEKVKIETTPFVHHDAEQVVVPLKYVSQVTQSFRHDQEIRNELRNTVEALLKKTRGELAAAHWPLANADDDDAILAEYVRRAEDLLVSRLVGGPK